MKNYKVTRIAELKEVWYINAKNKEDAINIAYKKEPDDLYEMDHSEMWAEENNSINKNKGRYEDRDR